MPEQIKLMLIEDSPDYRESITLAVSRETDIVLKAQYGTAEEALREMENTANRESQDIVLLDLNLPGMSGLEALPWLKKYLPKIKVIVLTQSNHEADVIEAIYSGADGYLLKGARRKQIFEGIRSVLAGGAMFDPQVAKYLLKTAQTQPRMSQVTKALSKRELQILTLLGEGHAQKEISDILNVSNNTVVTYIRRIYEKLEVQNAPAAINKAHKSGLLPH